MDKRFEIPCEFFLENESRWGWDSNTTTRAVRGLGGCGCGIKIGWWAVWALLGVNRGWCGGRCGSQPQVRGLLGYR